jgi:23S rRNA pseudouridine955/2504/2580 synthase
MEFIINSDFHDVRLDKFLRKTYQEIPISGIFKMIRKGNVKVNKKKKKQNYRLQEGDTVRVWEPSAPTAAKSFIQLSGDEKRLIQRSIVYEDTNILLCNKPAGLVMHTGSSHSHGLYELVLSYTKNPHFTFVHRIDKMTSGLVMGAKNLATARKLSELIRARAIEKKYVVLVTGNVEKDHFTISTFLKTEEDKVRIHPDEKDGAKEGISAFTVIQRGPNHTLLEATLHTGRKHQLRVQLADIGHPIMGDGKYGKKGKAEQMFLFSQQLVVTSMEIDYSLPVPDSFYVELLKQ